LLLVTASGTAVKLQ